MQATISIGKAEGAPILGCETDKLLRNRNQRLLQNIQNLILDIRNFDTILENLFGGLKRSAQMVFVELKTTSISNISRLLEKLDPIFQIVLEVQVANNMLMSSALKLQDQNRLLKEEILDMVPAAQYARTLETVNELRSRALDLENSINGFNQHFAELQVENISLKQRMEVMPKCLLLDILC